MRLVFAGTPAAAVPSLDALLASSHSVAAVLTRPDAPSGRGRQVAKSPVAQRAEAAGLEILQPQRPSDADFLARLTGTAPDCCPVIAYGNLIPLPRSDIPRTAGSTCTSPCCPDGAARRRCSTRSCTVTRSPAPPRSGSWPSWTPVPCSASSPSPSGPLTRPETCWPGSPSLAPSSSSRRWTESNLASWRRGRNHQNGISHAPKIDRSDARVSWNQPALAIDRQIRACTPAPGAWTTLHGGTLKLGPVRGRYRPALQGGHSAGRGAGRATECSSAQGRSLSSSATCSQKASAGCPRPTGRAVCAAPSWCSTEMNQDSRRRGPAARRPDARGGGSELARQTAHAVLMAVSERDAYANLLLSSRCGSAVCTAKTRPLRPSSSTERCATGPATTRSSRCAPTVT